MAACRRAARAAISLAERVGRAGAGCRRRAAGVRRRCSQSSERWRWPCPILASQFLPRQIGRRATNSARSIVSDERDTCSTAQTGATAPRLATADLDGDFAHVGPEILSSTKSRLHADFDLDPVRSRRRGVSRRRDSHPNAQVRASEASEMSLRPAIHVSTRETSENSLARASSAARSGGHALPVRLSSAALGPRFWPFLAWHEARIYRGMFRVSMREWTGRPRCPAVQHGIRGSPWTTSCSSPTTGSGTRSSTGCTT